jgi:predicted DNA-binding ArsR family transcriptional regulator
MVMKTVGLDQALEVVKQEKLNEALAAGCVSVREVGDFLRIEKSRAWRLLRKYGYTRSATWDTPKRAKKASR